MRAPAFLAAWALLAALVLAPAPEAARAEGRNDAPRAGPDAVKLIFSELGRVENEAIQSYVEAVGQRVARAAPRIGAGYRFYVVDQWAPNAFALPDGSIFVSRGLLALSGSEEELANVLAHEITHVTQRHAIGRQAVSGGANPFLIGFARAAYIASFSREQEREADSVGQLLAASAGYDPRKMAEFLRKLEYAERIELGASRIPTFFDTHPATGERAGASYDRGGKVEYQPKPGLTKDPAEHLARLEGLVIGDDPAQGIFRGNRFVHPDLGFTIFFPDGWTPVNTPAAVGAFAPRGQARIALELAGEGDDPEAVARAYLPKKLEDAKARLEQGGPVTIAGKPAYEAIASVPTAGGQVTAQLTFVPLGGRVYVLSLAAVGPSFSANRGRFTAAVKSFRALEPEEVARIDVMRLRSARAEAGETLAELSRRTRNALDLQRTAVANGIFTEGTLTEGQVVKVAVSERYRPATPPATVAAPPPAP